MTGLDVSPADTEPAATAPASPPDLRLPRDARRWTAVGTGLAFVAFWLLGTMGSPTELLSTEAITGNFFDAQARSLMAGHFSVPKGVAMIEGFATDHGTQLYFGVFPALLRMPVLAVTHAFDGRLSLPSELLAVVVMCVATARLARLAQLQVARAHPGVLTLSSRWFALFAAAPVLCSPVLFLASRSLVYHEAIMWGAAAGLWGLEAALRWWFEPTGRHLAVAALVAGVAIGSRPASGLAPVLALFLFGAVLAGRRRWTAAAAPLAAGLFAVATYVAVNVARFGMAFGAPWERQVAYGVSPLQQRAVAVTGGAMIDPRFAVTSLSRYLNPWPGLMRPTRLFPFVEWGPVLHAKLGSPIYIEDTGSLPTAAPLVVLCALVGAWWLWRCRTRTAWAVPVAAALLASSVTVMFWAVSHRYLVDLVPPAVILGVPGAWVALGWLRDGPKWRRSTVMGVAAALTVIAALGQTGIAIWSHHFAFLPVADEQRAFVELQYSIDDSLFGGAPPRVRRVGDVMPPVEESEVVIVGDCVGVYLGQLSWVPIERTSGAGRRAVVVATAALDGFGTAVVPLAAGDGWRIEARPVGALGVAQLVYTGPDGIPAKGGVVGMLDGRLALDVVADPWTGEVSVAQAGRRVLDLHGVAADGLRVDPGWTVFPGGDPFCRSLLARLPDGTAG